jgi:hypothetical protein
MNNKPVFVNITLHILGLLLCIVPPTLVTVSYFPIWNIQNAETVLAGGGVLVLTLCALPLWKLIIRVLRSPASYLMWLIIFLLFFLLSKIADEMVVISFFGLVGNLLGALCFFIERKLRK